MRFISKHGKYGVQIQPLVEEAYATGISKTVQKPLYAMFQVGDLRPEERELAMARWTWNGFYQQEDEVTVVPPDYRIGVFDSEREITWTDEEREYVERELCRLAEIDSSHFMAMPRTMIQPPWPRYDEFDGSPAQLVSKLAEDGYSLQTTLDYETAMQNRPDVIAAIQAALTGDETLVDFDPNEVVVLG